ncbi:hypothetical protein [Algoriphagus sp.]|uniref:hypothetical protein n=1 Tax=Algoriphagus sp. TaxID=1872435 RepID=UPI00391DFB82
MKRKSLLTICLGLLFSVIFAQQKLKVVRKSDAEKPKVERVDAQYTEVPRIQDPVKSQVERIEDGPTNKVVRMEDAPKTKVVRLDDSPTTMVDRIEDGPKTKVERIEDGPKPKVERLPGEPVKPNVPIITDPTPTQIDRIEDGPIPNVERIEDGPRTKIERIVEPKRSTIERIEDDPKTKVERLEDPKRTDVKILEDEDGGNPGGSEGREVSGVGGIAPNAGRGVKQNQNLGSRFQFNRKIGFYISAPEGEMASYFYFDTHTGASLMDHSGNEALIAEKVSGEVNQIFTHSGDFLSFTKSSEGNYSFKMGAGTSPEMGGIPDRPGGDSFFDLFKPTGKKLSKGQGGHKFDSVEYKGKHEGKTYSIYLADPGQVRLDPNFTQRLTGHFGLGYIADSSGKTYMLTGFQDGRSSIFMTYNESSSKSFDGSGYKSMGGF